MTDTVAKPSGADQTAMRSIADAMRDAATARSEHADKVKPTASEAGPKALELISQMFYTSSYVLVYGVVYAAVFIAQSLPQEKSVMRGLHDGGLARLTISTRAERFG
jgi:hypothetical protein